MKIQPAKTNIFIDNIPENVCSALVYGPDSGGVQNTLKKISENIVNDINDPFSVVNLDCAKIIEEPSIIRDEILAMSFGGGRRLITIKNAEGKDVTEAIKVTVSDLPDNISRDAFLLVSAGDLSPASALRKLYEKESILAALSCYLDDVKSLPVKINALLRERELKAESGVVEYLATYCQGDSKIVENEIEKLALYCLGKEQIELQDVYDATGNSTEANLQDICNLIFSGNRTQLEVMLRTASESGVSEIAIIRSAQRYLEKLHIAYQAVKINGVGVDEAVNSLRPPIFFKQKPIFRQNLMSVLKREEKYLWQKYSLLYQAEAKLKETGADLHLVTSRALQRAAY